MVNPLGIFTHIAEFGHEQYTKNIHRSISSKKNYTSYEVISVYLHFLQLKLQLNRLITW
jgi:hypothetical protein